MDLTEAQQQVVSHAGGVLLVRGGPATGKSTALHHRYLRLVSVVGAGRVLVLHATRDSAMRFRDRVLGELRGGFDALPITTPWGLAHDIVQRHGRAVRLLSRAEQRGLVRDLLLRDGDRADAAYVDEVADAVEALRGAGLAADALAARADAAGRRDRWGWLLAFAPRYGAALEAAGAIDGAGLLAEAAALTPGAAERYDAVIVDDHHRAGAAASRLLAALCRSGRDCVIATDNPARDARVDLAFPVAGEIVLDRAFRTPAPPVLVECAHPALEADAATAVLLEAASRGVAWRDMAVLVRQPAARARSLSRALARHGIPVTTSPADPLAEPAARGIVDMLRWVAGDSRALPRVVTSPVGGIDVVRARALQRDTRNSPDGLAAHPELADLVALHHELADAAAAGTSVDQLAALVWRRRLTGLVADPDRGGDDPARARALDAVVAFLDGIETWCARNPSATLDGYLDVIDSGGAEADGWRLSAGADDADTVAILSIHAAAGREWRTVVITGCVEGELPRITGRVRWFDRELLIDTNDPSALPTVAQRRLQALEDERELFTLATTRATDEIVAIAARQPGVLLSRFVADWPRRAAPPPFPDRPPRPSPPVTENEVAVWPDGSIVLSASSVSTWQDCRLRYLFANALRTREPSTVWADFGSLVHEVLARFLDPAAAEPRAFERLLEIAEDCWRDDVAPYRPQREQIRRDLYDVLTRWWELEGANPLAHEVVAVERRFDLPLPPHHALGFIDRIDRVPGDGIEIIDYKTGRKPLGAEEAADDIQLALYHLAATHDPELRAMGEPAALRLLYLRQPTVVEQPIEPDHAARTEARVRAVAEEMLAEGFTPSVEAECRLCDYHRLCPLQPAGREVGVDV